MDVNTVPFLNFVLNSIIVIVFLLFSKTSLEKIRNILDILNNGGYKNCPFYSKTTHHGDDLEESQKN